MKYVYDIVLNFNSEYYDFYEWNINDKITNIKKIPLYRVSKKDYLNIKYNDVIINNLNSQILLITNTLEVMGIMLTKKGKVIKKSSLLIDEEEEILKDSDNLKITKLEFKKNIYRKRKIIERNKLDKQKYVQSFLRKINKEKDLYLLKYIYYDLYKQEENINTIYDKLKLLDIEVLYKELKKIKVK